GGGAGVTITPVAFIAVSGEHIRILPINNDTTAVDKAITMAPELIDKVKDLFSKEKKEPDNK
ncbi:GerW family sporulation protein, partial [Klebsiella pneumoniae]|uniref:GerW family sporulation protein n=1 Tax=Klebsiella pneumoniae TaxID=573 RepID=UPI0025A1CCF3